MANMSVNNISSTSLNEQNQLVGANHLLGSNQLHDVSLEDLQKNKDKLRRELKQILKLIQKGKYEKAKTLLIKYYDKASQTVSKLKQFIDQKHPENEKAINKDLDKLQQEFQDVKKQVQKFQISKGTGKNCIIILEASLEKSAEGNNATLKQFLDRSNYVLDAKFKQQMADYHAESVKIGDQVTKIKNEMDASHGFSIGKIAVMVGIMVAGAALCWAGGAAIAAIAETAYVAETAFTVGEAIEGGIEMTDMGVDTAAAISDTTEEVVADGAADGIGEGDTEAVEGVESSEASVESPASESGNPPANEEVDAQSSVEDENGADAKAKAKAKANEAKADNKINDEEGKGFRKKTFREKFPNKLRPSTFNWARKALLPISLVLGGIADYKYAEAEAPKDYTGLYQAKLSKDTVQSQAIYSGVENTMNDKRQNFTQEQNVTSQIEATTNQITTCQQTFVSLAKSAFGRG